MVPLSAMAPFLQEGNLSLGKLILSGREEHEERLFASEQVQIRLSNPLHCSQFGGIASEFGRPMPLILMQEVVHLDHAPLGCRAYSKSESATIHGRVLVVLRGGCTFYRKALWAQRAGATAVLFVNTGDDGKPIRAVGEPASTYDQDVKIPSATIGKEDGHDLIRFSSGKGATMDILTGPPIHRRPVKYVVKVQDVPIHNMLVLMHL